MIIKVERGKPVNKTVEIDTDKVVHSTPFGKGGMVSMEDGEAYAFNSVEWAQWIDQNSWAEETIDVKDLHKHSKIQPEFVKVVRDKRGLYEKGKIR